MPLVWTTKTVEINFLEDPGAEDFALAELIALSHPYGEAWGTAQLRFPNARAQDTAAIRGKAVRITYDDRTIFSGHVVETPLEVGADSDAATATLADYRWFLDGRKVGQAGIGSLTGDDGFPVVGRRIHFNPDGRGNRAADPVEGEENLYQFDDSATSVSWTAQDILVWLLHWYGAGVTLTVDDLPAGWDLAEPDFLAYGLSLPQALSKLTARIGQSWSLAYDGEAINFVAIASPGTVSTVVTLPTAAAPGSARNATALAARRVRVLPRITDSFDRVEIHTAPTRCDMTLTNKADATDASPWLTQFAPGSGWLSGYYLDPTKITAEIRTSLELLPEANPRRWIRELLTMRADDGTEYLVADDPELLAGYGDRVYAETCVWLARSDEPTAEPRRLKSGFRLEPESMVLLLSPQLVYADGTEINSAEWGSDVWHVWLTVCVEWASERAGTSTYVDPPLIDANHRRTQMIVRNDIVPRKRLKVYLPTLGTSNLNAIDVVAADVETYIPHIPVMQALYEKLSAITGGENFVEAELLDIPAIMPGTKLEVSPAALGLNGREVITHFEASFGDANLVRLFATSALNRLPVGDA